jgi:hypothetical protein
MRGLKLIWAIPCKRNCKILLIVMLIIILNSAFLPKNKFFFRKWLD